MATVLATLNAREGWNWPESYMRSSKGMFGSLGGSNAATAGGQNHGFSAMGFAANPALASHASMVRWMLYTCDSADHATAD
jgi:hypothetical protein